MPTSIITTDDLRDFKMELLDDIKKLLIQTSRWKDSKNTSNLLRLWTCFKLVREHLQNLRINGTLPYTKVGGIIYYDTEEIQNSNGLLTACITV